MTGCRVAVLTPPGTGAIATIAVVGEQAWELVGRWFRRPGGQSLPALPRPEQIWFGTLGDTVSDEVILACPRIDPEPWVEIHCHGGIRVVRCLVELFCREGCEEISGTSLLGVDPCLTAGIADPRALEPLTRASTVRTASILLDQAHGAYFHAVAGIVQALDHGDGTTAVAQIEALEARVPLGRHLLEPWSIVIAGPPNVGKSSLINALAGYQRSVVAPIPGTTRDLVRIRLAFDGWPVELTDTAGLRIAVESLEAEGIARSRAALASANLVVWLLDASVDEPISPPGELVDERWLIVKNKVDLRPAAEPCSSESAWPEHLRISAATGQGVAGLVAAIARRLVPEPPLAGAAVPFTPGLADAVEAAAEWIRLGEFRTAREILADSLPHRQ